MLALELPSRLDILCLGAHCDDIEIGCGGTLLQLGARPDVSVHWVVFSGDATRRDEARASAAEFLATVPRQQTEFLTFGESFFPAQWEAIKQQFERLKSLLNPSLVLTHFRGDDHQDHRVIAELTWNTFRDHLILEYEIPKYEDDLGRPTVFVPIEGDIAERKVAALRRHFVSQHHRSWFSDEVFLAHLRLRGLHGRIRSGYAEAFHCRKTLLRI